MCQTLCSVLDFVDSHLKNKTINSLLQRAHSISKLYHWFKGCSMYSCRIFFRYYWLKITG